MRCGRVVSLINVACADEPLHRAYIVPTKGIHAYPTDTHKKKCVDDIHAWMQPKVAHYKRLTGGIILTEDFPRL